MFTLHFTEVRLEEDARRGALLHETDEKTSKPEEKWKQMENLWG